MQIISSRMLLFEKEVYHAEVVDGKETGRKIQEVQDKILVQASTTPQIVPDWVKDTDLFNTHVDDGTIIEVTVSSKAKAPNANAALKGINTQTATPVAEKVKESNKAGTDKAQQQTGWGES